MIKAGKLDTKGLTVYGPRKSDGSYFYMEGGKRIEVHGNTKWTTFKGVAMKGNSKADGGKLKEKKPAAANVKQPAKLSTQKRNDVALPDGCTFLSTRFPSPRVAVRLAFQEEWHSAI